MAQKTAMPILSHLRHAFDLGQHRLEIVQRRLERNQVQKKRERAVCELGRAAWQHQVRHPEYQDHFTKMTEIDQNTKASAAVVAEKQRAVDEAQSEKDTLEQTWAAKIAAFEKRKEEGLARIAELADQRQRLERELGELKGRAEAKPEADLESDIAERRTRLEGLAADENPVRQALEDNDKQLSAARKERVRAVGTAEARLQAARTELTGAEARQNEGRQAMERSMAELGGFVAETRPDAAPLAETYAALDDLNRQHEGLSQTVDRLAHQIETAGPAARRTLYAVLAAAFLFFLLLALIFSLVFSSGGGSASAALGYGEPEILVSYNHRPGEDWVQPGGRMLMFANYPHRILGREGPSTLCIGGSSYPGGTNRFMGLPRFLSS